MFFKKSVPGEIIYILFSVGRFEIYYCSCFFLQVPLKEPFHLALLSAPGVRSWASNCLP